MKTSTSLLSPSATGLSTSTCRMQILWQRGQQGNRKENNMLASHPFSLSFPRTGRREMYWANVFNAPRLTFRDMWRVDVLDCCLNERWEGSFLFSVLGHPISAQQFLTDRHSGCSSIPLFQTMVSRINHDHKHSYHTSSSTYDIIPSPWSRVSPLVITSEVCNHCHYFRFKEETEAQRG